MVMAARPGVGADGDRLFEFLRHQLRDASGLEAQRLLYVACTRAKRQLRLTATVGGNEVPEQAAEDEPPAGVWSPPAGSLLAVLWPVAGGDFAVPRSAAVPAGQSMGAPRGGPLLRVPRDWNPTVETGPAPAELLPAPPEPREEWPVFDWAGETARRVGTLVHAELQAMDPASSNEHTVRGRHAHFRRWLALHGVPAERLQEAASRVVEALVAVQGDARGRWILQQTRENVREHALSGRVAAAARGTGPVVRVIFDRSFVDDEGIRWVIDYKTSQHQGSGLEEFLDREVERYRPQLQRYAGLARRLGPQPVRLGLYFPLMRAWREWADE